MQSDPAPFGMQQFEHPHPVHKRKTRTAHVRVNVKPGLRMPDCLSDLDLDYSSTAAASNRSVYTCTRSADQQRHFMHYRAEPSSCSACPCSSQCASGRRNLSLGCDVGSPSSCPVLLQAKKRWIGALSDLKCLFFTHKKPLSFCNEHVHLLERFNNWRNASEQRLESRVLFACSVSGKATHQGLHIT